MKNLFLKLLFIGAATCLASMTHAQVKYIYLNISQPNIEECVTNIESTFQDCNFKIYPNPSDGTFTLEIENLSAEKEIDLYVYDISGKAVINQQLCITNKLNKTIDLSGHKSGTYFLNIKGKRNALFKAKLIIY